MLENIIILSCLFMVAMIGFATLANRLHIPYAVVLVIGGCILGFLPGVPTFTLASEFILLLFLPPLIFTAAWTTSWRNFRAELFVILLFAIGLVLFTMVCVACIARAILPVLSWPSAFILGAIVAPTDAVAASAILQRLSVSRRIQTIIEGESLVNDATAIVAFRFAVIAAISGTFSLGTASLQFLIVSLGGLLVGLLTAIPISWVQKHIDHAPSEITLTLVTAFGSYLLAEIVDVSSVLATMSAGLYLSRKSSRLFTPSMRLQGTGFWNVLIFLLNGIMFLIVGLELRVIINSTATSQLLSMLAYAGIISLTVILARLIWPFATLIILLLVSRHTKLHRETPNIKGALVIGWSGMRGGVSLATALAVPEVISSGASFSDREVIIFITFIVILTTLFIQGLTLGPFIRVLGLGRDTSVEIERQEADRAILTASIARIDSLLQEDWTPKEHAQQSRTLYERKLHVTNLELEEEERKHSMLKRANINRFDAEITQTQRQTALALRDNNKIDDEIFHQIERRLDLEDQRLREK